MFGYLNWWLCSLPVSGSGITNTVGSGGAVGGVGGGGSSTVGGGVAPGSTAGLAPGQVTYLTSAVPGGGGTPGLTLRQVHQVGWRKEDMFFFWGGWKGIEMEMAN